MSATRSVTLLRVSASALIVLLLLTLMTRLAPASSALGQFGRASVTTWLVLVAVTGTSALLGVVFGAAAAHGPRLLDALLARAVEVGGVLPSAVLLVLVARYTGGNGIIEAALLAALRSIEVARLVRGETLRLGAEPFVSGARALGAGPRDLFHRHLWPHLVGSVAVASALTSAYVIALEAAVAYLDPLGPRAVVTWGTLLARSGGSLTWLGLGAATLTTLSLFGVAEALTRTSPHRSGQTLAAPAHESR